MVILAMPVALASLASAAVGTFSDCDPSSARARTPDQLAVPSAERMKIRMHRLGDIIGQSGEAGGPPRGGRAPGASFANGGEGEQAGRAQALGATFDQSRGGASPDVEAEGGAALRSPVREGIGGRCLLAAADPGGAATEHALSKLSPWQQAVAKKAIPLIDRLGQSLGVYSMLRSMGVREPRVFVLSLIQNESAFNPGAVSPKDARGLMQVLHGSTDLDANVRAGMAYLDYSLRTFGRPDYALASYNAGDGAVKTYLEKTGQIPPFEETRAYVKSIFKTYTSWVGSRLSAFSSRTLASLY